MKFQSLILALLLFSSCKDNTVVQGKVKGETASEDPLIARNKEAMRVEQQDIVNYIRRHDLKTTETGTGVHISFFEDLPGPTITPGEEVLIEHSISLLNGRACYRTKLGEPESFFVEQDDVESGLHEGIQQLSVGDSALVIIPSHLAHGLAGDLDQIPMRSTIIYNIRLLAAR